MRRLKTSSGLVRMRCGRLRRPMPSTMEQTLRECKNSSGTRTSKLHASMIDARRARRIRRCLRWRIRLVEEALGRQRQALTAYCRPRNTSEGRPRRAALRALNVAPGDFLSVRTLVALQRRRVLSKTSVGAPRRQSKVWLPDAASAKRLPPRESPWISPP